jgi:hypothetical protein
MGILDDAIKEHLELKRRHGVAEDELQRQEEEALGPARRDVAQQHEEAEPAAAGQDAALFDGETPAEHAAAEEHAAAIDEPEPELEPEPEPDAEPEEELAEQPEEPEDELVDPDLEDEDGDNDVLEDTPDFLQETPEHDRLWFEQKPPRDFDFD